MDWAKAKLGDSIASVGAPTIAGKPFTIQCTLDTKKPNGVILAHGGSAVGYVLYAKDGEIVFAVRHSTNRIQRVTLRPAKAPFAITAKLTAAQLSLTINGRGMTVKAVDLLRRHPQEDLDIGHDAKNPVDSEAPRAQINGKLTNLKVTLP